jgi:hypothetical protein
MIFLLSTSFSSLDFTVGFHCQRGAAANRCTSRGHDRVCSRPDRLRRLPTASLGAKRKRVGREMRMLVENSDDQAAADPGLPRIIARAQDRMLSIALVSFGHAARKKVNDEMAPERFSRLPRRVYFPVSREFGAETG